jgi:hypothetical protein
LSGVQKKEHAVPVIKGGKEKPQLGIDLTLCPQDWVPEATNERIRFTARIYTYNKDNGEWEFEGDGGEKRKITFNFKNVSKEPGICMNFPAKDKSNKNPDLFFPDDGFNTGKFDFSKDQTDNNNCPNLIVNFDDNPAHRRHYLEATTKQLVSEVAIEVRCEDYGAYGTLQASAPDCKTLQPRSGAACSQNEGLNDVKIPRDTNRNNIADSAPHDNGGAASDQDEDNDPVGDGTQGDGLTNYEEYRGFIVVRAGLQNRHIRTNINEKDIFIFDKDLLSTGYFNESGLKIHFIRGQEYYGGDSKDDPKKGKLGTGRPERGTQIINFNSGFAHGGDQHGIRLVNEKLPGVSGFTFASDKRSPGPPGNINRVAIDRDAILRRNIPNRLQKTIAHELGHAVRIKHHGELEANWRKHVHGDEPTWARQDGGPEKPVELGGLSEAAGGVSSGDVRCVMRYDNLFTRWCHDNHECIHGIFTPPDKETPGSIFCDTRDGSGVNRVGPNHENRATRGNCRSQIRVKDW